MGIPSCFKALGCFEVTFILKDFKTVTGKIVGNLDDRKKYEKCEDKKDDKHWEKDDKCCDDHKKDDDKCCCKPYVDVKVDVDDKCDFILVELTRDASTVILEEVELEENGITELEIEWATVEFEAGSCILLNVCDIIYAGVNADIDEFDVDIPLGPVANGATTPTTPT